MPTARKWILGAAAAVAAAAAIGTFVSFQETSPTAAGLLQPDDPAVVAAGSRIYRDECATCHGAGLAGQPDWQRRRADGKLPAPPHDATGHTWHHPDAVLFALTKYGPAKLIGDPAYKSDMPGYDGMLSDEGIVAVLSYIKSTWPAAIRERHDRMNDEARGN